MIVLILSLGSVNGHLNQQALVSSMVRLLSALFRPNDHPEGNIRGNVSNLSQQHTPVHADLR